MLSGSSGFYTYAIYEHLKEWPAFDLDNTRIAFKPRKDKYVNLCGSQHFGKNNKNRITCFVFSDISGIFIYIGKVPLHGCGGQQTKIYASA